MSARSLEPPHSCNHTEPRIELAIETRASGRRTTGHRGRAVGMLFAVVRTRGGIEPQRITDWPEAYFGRLVAALRFMRLPRRRASWISVNERFSVGLAVPRS